MMSNNMLEKIKVAMDDSDFEEKVAANLNSEAELKELFATKDIVMTDEEIGAFCQQVRSTLDNEGGKELGEDDLENVTGGVFGWAILAAGSYVGGILYAKYAKKKLGLC